MRLLSEALAIGLIKPIAVQLFQNDHLPLRRSIAIRFLHSIRREVPKATWEMVSAWGLARAAAIPAFHLSISDRIPCLSLEIVSGVFLMVFPFI